MNLKDFKSGIHRQQIQYQSFSPTMINHAWFLDDSVINVMIERATHALSSLDAFSVMVPNVDLFIQMHIYKEADASSRIEGTKTVIGEALMEKDDIAPEKRNDWQEVRNYVAAINQAVIELEKLPLSTRLLRQTHAILMQGARGENKFPGEFRKSQNWIGGSSLSDAAYIPPHWEEIPELMTDLEKFWHNDFIHVPNLIRIGISHYQFETIHPFCDGNGRIGRLMIPLYLIYKGVLRKPSLYISDFFEKNRSSYYDALERVRHSNDLSHWIRFFLNAVITTSEKGVATFNKILALKKEIDEKILTLNKKAKNAQKLMELLYKKPIISGQNASSYLGITPRPTNELLKELIQMDILVEMTGYKRNKIYALGDYLLIYTE